MAEAAAAEGQPGADKAWGSCFVTALNAAAMRGCLANSNAAAAGGGAAGSAAGGSQQGDKRRCERRRGEQWGVRIDGLVLAVMHNIKCQPAGLLLTVRGC